MKKERIKRIGLALAVMVMMWCVSCTRNNGDIGNWFGTWQLMQISADGTPDTDYEKNIFWKFQNNIICMVRVVTDYGDNTRYQRWGTWEESDGVLLLNFTYSDDSNSQEKGENGSGIYVPYTETHLSYGEVSVLRIVREKGSELWLEYEGEDGVKYEYYLKKQ